MNVLDVQNLTLSFGENTLFSDLSFDIQDKEKVGFVGVNGAGKTSLFKIITGEYKADSGNCFISRTFSSLLSIAMISEPDSAKSSAKAVPNLPRPTMP